jgi:glycosyltransferase involved in cell wall biosynthesis
MKYSVIIPCYTPTESDFKRCLEAIAKQTIKPYEVIVVDDESPTEVPKMALEYGFKYIRHEVNKHNGGARNTGIREATGDYLIFCNADDYFELDAIEQIDKVNKGQDVIIVGFSTFGKWSNTDRFIPDGDPYISKHNWNGEALHVVNRKFILDNNLFELENVPIADRDWTLRLEKVMKTHTFVPKALYNYQVGHKGAIMTDILEGEIVNNLKNPEYYNKNNIELMIYEHYLNRYGGNITFLKNFIKKYSEYYNIKVIYKDSVPSTMKFIKKYAETEKWTGQTFNTEICMWNSTWGTYPKVKAKKYIQMIHADYDEVNKLCGFEYNKPEVETTHIAVGKHVAKVFKKRYDIDCIVIPNLLNEDAKPEKVLRLISATRLIPTKGLNRIIKLGEQLNKQKRKFIWFIYGDGHDVESIKRISSIQNIVLMPVSDDLTSYIADADYFVHLSDTEGDPYCTKEALQVNTPCIVTNYPCATEQITDGVNGYILDMNLENLDIDKIYKKIPNFKYEMLDTKPLWLKALGKPVGIKRSVPEFNEELITIIARLRYFDMELGRDVNKGEVLQVSEERANYLVNERKLAIKEE